MVCRVDVVESLVAIGCSGDPGWDISWENRGLANY